MKISTLQKLFIFSFIILVGIGFLGYVIYKSNQKLLDSEKWIQHTEQVINESNKILILGLDIETASRGYIITSDSTFLEPLNEAEKTVFDNIKQLRQLVKDNPAQQKRADSLNFYMHNRLNFSLQSVFLRRNKGLAASIAYSSTKQGKFYTDQIRQFTNIIQQEEASLLQQRKQTNEHSVTMFNIFSIVMYIVMAVFTILLLIAIGNYWFQNKEKEKRAAELVIANKELIFQQEEKGKRAAELIIADKEVVFQYEEKEKQVAANKELEAFSYSVSHDLRAPLRHIGGYIDLLIKNNASQLDETGLRYLNTISESSHEMGSLIDALLTFSRLSRTEMQRTKINSKNMVSGVFKSFNDELNGRNVEINISELPDIMGDEILIKQVWVNLISNAIKYSRNVKKAVIDVGSNVETDKTVFYIKDNGTGFDMKYVNKLFGVFQRLHKARDFEGIGIGLADANRIIVRHGGKCWAESEVGKGATFFFSVPII